MAPLWRLAGNPQFDQSLEWIEASLKAGGVATRYDTIASPSQGWEMRDAVLRLDGPAGEIVLSREQDRVPLAINSFATPAGGTTAPLVDVGAGTEPRHYEGRSVKGAVVLADGPIGAVWNQAVKARGAAGVISTQIAPYTRPETTPGVLQWGNIPYAADTPSFGFKATPRAARRLRERLAAGPVQVHVTADTVFHRRPVRSLVAEFPGTRWPDDRVVLVAHVQEPGANDNASGSGTLLATALALQKAIADGALPRPARTLTLIWGDEIRASDAWIAADPARVAGVLAMMSLDMTGEDTAKTGGTFLIEKGPDPTAVWARPSDPHTEWGASEVDRALAAWQLPERPAPRRRAAPRPRHRLGGAHRTPTKAAATTPRSPRPACRRCSTGTSPTATTTPTSTPSTRSARRRWATWPPSWRRRRCSWPRPTRPTWRRWRRCCAPPATRGWRRNARTPRRPR